MRRTATLLISIVFLFWLVGCGSRKEEIQEQEIHRLKSELALKKMNRVATISNGDTSSGDKDGACELDYPVAVIRNKKNHTVQWESDTSDAYWVRFVKVDGNQMVVKRDLPLVDKTDNSEVKNPVRVPAYGSGPSAQLKIKSSPNNQDFDYYMYEIWREDPNKPNQDPTVDYKYPCAVSNLGSPCKCYDSDHDAGLNIKP